MRAIIQKVSKASVVVENEKVSEIGPGFMVLLGVKDTDDKDDLAYIKKKISNLRIFEDDDEKMNLSLKDVGGEILMVSQFTLYGDARKGNRPSFTQSAKADKAKEYYEILIDELKEEGFNVKTGIFQTHMQVILVNDGPVTIILDSERIL
ncbi:D-tyrosyl-tRNA(Tyr) deacylase [Anaerococcus prevotii]|uniref:D-aminoacyl-tRNA deacylase n=1 Tax=Anaerococcus prevotii (strain ATCC 9321 / DSM 20548 / JCM 6508 / NCTC 11806 / PC1) TaxID=525919 RepID=C7RHH8_ANAPD|nr:D-aminoacyl-tRNA deacylase [Anaerococcus prevotii]ACV28939.1 D-tyrosyl-tRNA(Tyr) deacylase [Anaerococcus prevotii DSM 20548]SUU94612.1 D-tyrosyl-tRNA(Tyr) deacylase [Anaerococcus prevotii]